MAKWMTHPKGGVMKIENSMQEESCLLHGWTYCDPPGAKPVKQEPALSTTSVQFVNHTPPDCQPSLTERAERVGLKVDRRWSGARLKREVEDAEAAYDMLP